MERKMVTFSYEKDNKFFFIENVLAEVCTRCGEKTYSPEVAEELVRIAKDEFKPKKTIPVPVFDFAEHF